jgi:hypothetical protein
MADGSTPKKPIINIHCPVKNVMRSLLPVLGLLFSLQVLAQTPAPPRRLVNLYLMGGTGPAAYKGELGNYQKWSALFNFSLQWSRNRWLNPVLDINVGRLAGNSLVFSSPDGQPNRFFTTQFANASFNLHFNILKTPNYQVYLSQGLGFARFTVRDDLGNDLATQPQTRALDEELPNTALVLPTGIGAAYFFPNDFGIGVEANWLNPRTAYLDNIGELGTNKKDNVFRVKVAVYVPLNYVDPQQDEARRERKVQRRQELEEQLRKEKEAFEQEKKSTQKTKTTKKAPAKKKKQKRS